MGSGLAPYPTSIDSTEVSDSAGTVSSKLLSGAQTVVPARPSACRNARWVSRRNSPADGVGAEKREWTTRTRRSVSRQPWSPSASSRSSVSSMATWNDGSR